jgi:drug/metabolite transporter (DMT)-like permease
MQPDRQNLIAGVAASLCSLMCWCALIVSSRALIVTYGFDPWAFTLVQSIGGGLVLVLATMGARANWDAARAPSTWAIGAARVVAGTCFVASLAHIPASHAGLLSAFNMPLSALMVWLFLGRLIPRRAMLGHFAILIAIAVMAMRVDGGVFNPAITLLLISEVTVTAANLLAERHAQNRGDIRARARLGGVVLLATALGFLALWTIVALLDLPIAALDLDSVRRSLADWRMWLAGALVGVLTRSPSMYFSLKAVRHIGADGFTLILSVFPLVAIAMEMLTAAAGLTVSPRIGAPEIAIGVLMVCAALFVGWARRAG